MYNKKIKIVFIKILIRGIVFCYQIPTDTYIKYYFNNFISTTNCSQIKNTIVQLTFGILFC